MTEIQTTHVGSLPRPSTLTERLAARDRGEDAGDIDELVNNAVADVVQRQRDANLTIINDGEAGRIGFITYVTGRLDGFGGHGDPLPSREADPQQFPEYFARLHERLPKIEMAMPACIGAVHYVGLENLRSDIENLQSAARGSGVQQAFMSAASPGVISVTLQNRYYETDEEYVWALAEQMKVEYDAIVAAGLILQLDCPDLTIPELGRERLELHMAALNHATRGIPADRMRMHVCWGNHEGPHLHDVPLGELIHLLLTARPSGLSFEGANPRHAHEWRVFQEVALPDDKVLIPGVIDSTTNYIEHPQLVADRIAQYVALVGPERVIASADCGFASLAQYILVDPRITWHKLRALVDGAALASRMSARAAGQ